MSSFKVYANARAVAGAATRHAARSTEPDICLLQDSTPAPFPNYIYTTELGTGQTCYTFVQDKPIWTKAGILDKSPSLDPHAGINKGKTSGTYMGVAEAQTASSDVIIEGNGVVCQGDDTWQNNRNTVGIVCDADEIADWLEAEKAKAEALAAAKAKKKAKAPIQLPPPEQADEDTGEEVDDGAGETAATGEHEDCTLLTVSITDKENRPADERQRLLEIVGTDTITGTADLSGSCPDKKHPRWELPSADGNRIIAPFESADFNIGDGQLLEIYGAKFSVPSFEATAALQMAAKIRYLLALIEFGPVEHTLTVEAHHGEPNPKQYTIAQYPKDELTIGIPEELLEKIRWLKRLFDKLSDAPPATRSALGGELTVSIGEPKFEFAGGWREWTDYRAFFAFNFVLRWDPLLSVALRFYIPLPPPAEFVRKIIGKIGISIGPYVEVGGSIGVEGEAGRQSPDHWPGVTATARPRFTIAIGADIRVKAGIFAEVRGEASVIFEFGIEAPKLLTPLYVFWGPLKPDSIKAPIIVAAAGGFAGGVIDFFGGEDTTFKGDYKGPFTKGQEIDELRKEIEFGGFGELIAKDRYQVLP